MCSVPPGDPSKGANIFKQRCAECHTTLEGGGNRTGPNLFGLFGRRTAAVAGYEYSQGLQYKSITWSDDTIFMFLESPKKYIPGTKMVFAGLKREDERADLISHLKEVTVKK